MSNFNGWQKTGKLLGGGGQGTVSLARRITKEGSEALQDVVQQFFAVKNQGTSPRPRPDAAAALVDAITQASSTDAYELGALKEFSINEGSTPEEAEKAMGRLRQEIETLCELGDEPGILRLLDANADENWMIAEFHPSTLTKEIDRYKGDVLRSLEAFRPLVSAVATLHKRGIVHRDIKPDNIFVSHKGDLVLGDFGIVFYANADAAG